MAGSSLLGYFVVMDASQRESSLAALWADRTLDPQKKAALIACVHRGESFLSSSLLQERLREIGPRAPRGLPRVIHLPYTD